MPIHTSPIQNAYHAIDHPIAEQVTRQLIQLGVLIQPKNLILNDNLHSTRRISNQNTQYPGELSLITSIQITRVEQADWALKRRWLYLPPVFHDPNLGVRIFPMYNDYEYQIVYTYMDDNLEVLRSIRDHLMVKRDIGYTGSSHTLDYSLIASKETRTLLQEIFDRRENRHGYGDSYDDWMNLYSAPDYHPTRAGRHIEQTFAIRQNNIEGGLYGEIPSIEEYELGIYSFEITYTFRIARPVALITQYPIIIHQQLLPKQYTLTDNQEHEGYGFTDLPVVKGVVALRKRLPFRVPTVDTYELTKFPNGYYPLWTALLSIEDKPIEDEVLCRLDQVEGVAIHPDIIKYLREVGHTEITTPYNTPFLVALHRDNLLLDYRYLTVNNLLEVRLTEAVDLRASYRLSFYILRDLTALKESALAPLNTYALNVHISDTLNIIRSDAPFPRNDRVVPRDLTEIGYCRLIAPLLNDWQSIETGSHRDRSGAITMRTIMRSKVTAFHR